MSNVIAFQTKEERSPHVSGKAFCIECHHEWVSVAPTGTTQVECPSCHTHKGLFRYPCEPEGAAWACSCGCQLFMISTSGILCYKCGEYQYGY